MSTKTTKVPPKNNNINKKSEILLDAMVCDDEWVDYLDDDEESKDASNQCTTAKLLSEGVTEEIPPKNDCPYSEVPNAFSSPKCKRKKLPGFDELLENLDFDIVHMNLTKLLLFLESNNKELTFPFNLKKYELFFNKIVLDINILKSRSFDAQYRDICDKIIEAASNYVLTCTFEYKQEFVKVVMVIIKEHKDIMMSSSKQVTTSAPTSAKSVVSTSKTSKKLEKLTQPRPNVSRGFKIYFLHTTLAFIKDDVTKTKEFFNLSPAQASFMQTLLESIITSTDFECNIKEIKDLIRSLWEAVKIYSLKYEFRIDCVESFGGKHNLVIEKILKTKAAGTAESSNQIMDSKPETQRPDVAEPWFAKPEAVKLTPARGKPARVTKKMLRKQIKSENETLLMKRLPRDFIRCSLNSILEFLKDDERTNMILIPNNVWEMEFYRKCLDWCRPTDDLTRFGSEFESLHQQIIAQLYCVKCQVPKGNVNKTNETTGIKEVTYVKVQPNASTYASVQSAPKMKKVNLQNALELAGTGYIQLASVVNLNQSLRNKKKTKKLKKAKFNKAKNSASSGSSTRGDTSSSCSSRGTSWDRSKTPKVQQPTKKSAKEQAVQEALQETMRIRRDVQKVVSEVNRKEQLREALSVPVQSEMAIRMMRSMGWSGGALGARGNGITEPLMPELDLARGAGLGHSSYSVPQPITKKSDQPKPPPSWVSESSNTSTESNKSEKDVIVQMTNQMLLENRTFDTVTKTTKLPKLNVATASEVELAKPTTSNVELSKQTEVNVELAKPTASGVELSKSASNDKIPMPFREEILHSILDLLDADATCKTLIYENTIPKKGRKFVQNAVELLKGGTFTHGIFLPKEFGICTEIQLKYKRLPELIVDATISHDFKRIEFKKQPIRSGIPVQPETLNPSLRAITDIITEKDIHSYIISTGSHTDSQKAYHGLKFRVLLLLNILNFVKSYNEEVEITFNRVLAMKQRSSVQNLVEEINMRVKFGSTPAETKLCTEIKNHIKDAFLGAIFNHEYTSVTLNKYFRFKRLNRPDNAVVKCTSQTSVDLDSFKSETFSEAKLSKETTAVEENNNTIDDEPEYGNAVDEDDEEVAYEYKNEIVLGPEAAESDPYDSDDSSVEEYDHSNSTTKVPKLPPGEEGVNLTEFLHLYDKEKTNKTTTDKNNEENRNINNNGNIFIDNNDNQVIDMKREGDNIENTDVRMTEVEKDIDTEMAQCVVLDDFTIKSSEMTIDVDEDEFNLSGNLKGEPIKDSEIEDKNSDDNIDVMIDTVLFNIEDPIEQEVNNIDDVTENMGQDDLKNNSECPPENAMATKKDTDVIMKGIDSKQMEVISVTDKSYLENNKEEKSIVINQGESMSEIGHGESIAVVGRIESVAIDNSESKDEIGKVESMVVIDKCVSITINSADSMDEIGKVDSMVAIDKSESMPIIANSESIAVIGSAESTDQIDNAESKVVIDNAESKVVIDSAEVGKGKSIARIDKSESMAVIDNAESISNTIKGDSIKVTNIVERSTDVDVAQIKLAHSINPADSQNVKGDNKLEIKTNCDIISKENIDLSGDNCDTKSLGLNDADSVDNEIDELNEGHSEIINVRIVNAKDPNENLTKTKISTVQKHISNSIMLSAELPLLKCHGVQNGTIIYTCHDKTSYSWLKNTISLVSGVKLLRTKEVSKMALRLYGSFDFDTDYLFKMIELYNEEVSTKDWVVENKEIDGDYVIYTVKMDKFSFNYIQESNFALYAGVDDIQFNLIWQ